MKKIKVILLFIIFLLICIDIYVSNLNINRISYNFNSLVSNSINNDLLESNLILKNYFNINSINYNYIFANGMFSSLYDEVVINKGSNDNILENSPVVSNNTLIGFVDIVYKNSSIVKPINKYILSVRVEDEYGILKEENGKLILSGTDNTLIGDKVYTSGLTNVLGNIYVGYVVNKEKDNFVVQRDISFNDYKYLLIIEDEDV